MVASSGAPLGASAVRVGTRGDATCQRAVNTPVPVRVQADAAGRPLLVQRRGWLRARRVARVQDIWRIDDEWWRERPVSRLYYTLLLEDGLLLTVYHDLVEDTWYHQEVG